MSGAQHLNSSQYTLATVHGSQTEEHEQTPLLASERHDVPYGSTPDSHSSSSSPSTGSRRSKRRILLFSGLKMAAIFVCSTLLLGGTLWLALPRLEDADRPNLRIPKSFAQLQALNFLLKKYIHIYPYRIVVCYVTTYLFLQAFSLPGSMYLSILGGAIWGVPRALPLACACVASGATLCYLLSSALGPALMALPSWHARLHTWTQKVDSQRANLLSFLIVARIAPFPPHWVVNIIAPHVGIGIPVFWVSTFLGVLGVTVIHTTIGNGLDDMTSADDFHLISWKNFLGLSAVVVGVLIPVALRYYLRQEVDDVSEAEDQAAEEEEVLSAAMGPEDELLYDSADGGRLLAQGPRIIGPKSKADADKTQAASDRDSTDGYDRENNAPDAGPAMVVEQRDDVCTADPPPWSST